jgi:hypothetical protein
VLTNFNSTSADKLYGEKATIFFLVD